MEDSSDVSVGQSEPPFWTAALPGIGGAIGPEPEDFRVDEVPAYLPSGAGEHRYVRIEKRGLTTPDAVRWVAQAAGVQPRDVGYAGLKDKHAITTQWLSLPRTAKPLEAWELPDSLRVLEASHHTNKLRTGHLRGNRFSIRVVGAVVDAAMLAGPLVERLEATGMANYFGAQRFGRGGENLTRALEWLSAGAKRRLSAFLLKLYPSVVQSAVFNEYFPLRAAEDLSCPLLGEVVRLEGSGATFVVEDPEAEERRLRARDIHLTGPMLGPKMRVATGRPRELEQAAQARVGLSDIALDTMGRFAPGARRDLLVHPEDLSFLDEGSGRLRLNFALPAGSYATVLVREFTRSTPLPREEATD